MLPPDAADAAMTIGGHGVDISTCCRLQLATGKAKTWPMVVTLSSAKMLAYWYQKPFMPASTTLPEEVLKPAHGR